MLHPDAITEKWSAPTMGPKPDISTDNTSAGGEDVHSGRFQVADNLADPKQREFDGNIAYSGRESNSAFSVMPNYLA